MKRNPYWISGWTFIQRNRISSLPKDVQDKVKRKGSSFTVKLKDRYHLYVNEGFIVGGSQEVTIALHRKFRPPNKESQLTNKGDSN